MKEVAALTSGESRNGREGDDLCRGGMHNNEHGASSDGREDDSWGGSLTTTRPVMVEESNYIRKEAEQVSEDGEVAMEGEALSSGRAAAIAAPLRIKERGAKVVALHNGGRICRG